MQTDKMIVRLAPNGRLGIPARQRARAGLKEGDLLVLEASDGELRIRSVDAVIDDLQAWAAAYAVEGGQSGVDMLIEERRREAKMEDDAEHG